MRLKDLIRFLRGVCENIDQNFKVGNSSKVPFLPVCSSPRWLCCWISCLWMEKRWPILTTKSCFFFLQFYLFSLGGQSKRSSGAFRGGALTKYSYFFFYQKLNSKTLQVLLLTSFKYVTGQDDNLRILWQSNLYDNGGGFWCGLGRQHWHQVVNFINLNLDFQIQFFFILSWFKI